MSGLWWLSFCDTGRPAGSQFLGVSIVRAPTLPLAAMAAHGLGVNPGGEIQALECPPDVEPLIHQKWLNRLLTKQECADLDAEIFAAKEARLAPSNTEKPR